MNNMTNGLTHNRWNWSQEENKWVYIESKDNGVLVFHYQEQPPKEFIELTAKINVLNKKLLACKDPEENARIFNEMIKISQRMQFMSKTC